MDMEKEISISDPITLIGMGFMSGLKYGEECKQNEKIGKDTISNLLSNDMVLFAFIDMVKVQTGIVIDPRDINPKRYFSENNLDKNMKIEKNISKDHYTYSITEE